MAAMSGGRGSMPQYLSQVVPNGGEEKSQGRRRRHAACGVSRLRGEESVVRNQVCG
jgi:hypothetical protein